VIRATSEGARLDAIVDALYRLDLSNGGAANLATPSSALMDLRSSLQAYSANTADQNGASSVLNSARSLAHTVQTWARNTHEIRLQTNSEIVTDVGDLNEWLQRLDVLDEQIVNGTVARSDITDQLDARDALIERIATLVGVNVVERGNNSIALYTDTCITLFDGHARAVTLLDVPLTDGVPGGALSIDGTIAFGPNSVMSVQSGRLAALYEVRDRLTLSYGAQLDDFAGTLIRLFSESDQSPNPTLPDIMGLFTSSSVGSVPPAGTVVNGLARAITVNANVDPSRGGNLLLLRDGGIGNPAIAAYRYNANDVSGYNDRVQELIAGFNLGEPHGAQTLLPDAASVMNFAAQSSGWLQGQRQSIGDAAEFATALLQTSKGALQKIAGISIDDEMATLLSLERTYQASAKLISAADAMFAALLQAVD